MSTYDWSKGGGYYNTIRVSKGVGILVLSDEVASLLYIVIVSCVIID